MFEDKDLKEDYGWWKEKSIWFKDIPNIPFLEENILRFKIQQRWL